jgi:putative phosphoribosyl transferase
MRFKDRSDAGRHLAVRLTHLRSDHVVVVGLPRGGIPVAAEVARELGAPLDVIVVRKLGVPFQPELAMGAIGEGGARVINEDIVRAAAVTREEFAAVEAEQRTELARRAQAFRGERPRISLAGRVVVVVDDGIATGSTARAACAVVRSEAASRVVLAVPVAPADWTRRLAGAADEFVCVETPETFQAVGEFYDDFAQTTDDEVVECLQKSSATLAEAAEPHLRDADVTLTLGDVALDGHLVVPGRPGGIVVFAHGSGSSRHSPRNRHVASVLNDAGLATLLFDLLTPGEERERSNVFDIPLLARRLVGVTRALDEEDVTKDLRVGYFGASTGAGAALLAAADLGARVGAVVSRGGRPDLAASRLAEVTAPTLLIVGGLDGVVLDLNRSARSQLRCQSRLAIVPGAGHLFEEPGTLRQVAELARAWFLDHLPVAA